MKQVYQGVKAIPVISFSTTCITINTFISKKGYKVRNRQIIIISDITNNIIEKKTDNAIFLDMFCNLIALVIETTKHTHVSAI